MKITVKLVKKEEPKPILLRDCKCGDVVRLVTDTVALVITPSSAVCPDAVDCDRAAILLTWPNGDLWAEMASGCAHNMITGDGPARIVEILGTLDEIVVQPKP